MRNGLNDSGDWLNKRKKFEKYDERNSFFGDYKNGYFDDYIVFVFEIISVMPGTRRNVSNRTVVDTCGLASNRCNPRRCNHGRL